ncbi:acyl-CoA N-acyltransferase [Xylaria cf. heliscus]|nr:acyl-CoA N-acyltransferase [Xylaria cf. heliscus]
MASSDESPVPTYRIRAHGPGDMGLIISQHGSQYAQEYGWGTSFEAATARIAADFLDNFDPSLERVFIAEFVETTQFLGSIALFKHREEVNTAHLRLLLVNPAARGMGLGSKLIDECILFARERGYAKVILWTFSVLEGARRLYKRAGFQLVSAGEEKDYWGTRQVAELWELKLSSVKG